MTGRRNCTACTRWRPVSDFSPRRWRNGVCIQLHSRCKVCRNADQNQKYATDPRYRRKRKEEHREHQATKRREKGILPRKVGPKNQGKYGAGRVHFYDQREAKRRYRAKRAK